MTARAYALEQTGDPSHQGLITNTQRALDMVRGDINELDASGVAYTPADATKWVAPAPMTVQVALDRVAANTGNAHPIP